MCLFNFCNNKLYWDSIEKENRKTQVKILKLSLFFLESSFV